MATIIEGTIIGKRHRFAFSVTCFDGHVEITYAQLDGHLLSQQPRDISPLAIHRMSHRVNPMLDLHTCSKSKSAHSPCMYCAKLRSTVDLEYCNSHRDDKNWIAHTCM